MLKNKIDISRELQAKAKELKKDYFLLSKNKRTENIDGFLKKRIQEKTNILDKLIFTI